VVRRRWQRNYMPNQSRVSRSESFALLTIFGTPLEVGGLGAGTPQCRYGLSPIGQWTAWRYWRSRGRCVDLSGDKAGVQRERRFVKWVTVNTGTGSLAEEDRKMGL